MAGYNHYPWCDCGWCAQNKQQPRGSINPLNTYVHESSLRVLKTSGADRSRAACFVNPNATCPECGALVYYYENLYGSRVFFDDLGPPWPKHPCTDKAGRDLRNWVTKPTIERRKKGDVATIEQAMVNTHFDWTELHTRVHKTALRELYQVEEILFVGFDNLMKLYRLDIELDVPDEARTSFLKYTSPKIRPQQGDIVSVGDGRIWVLDRKTWRSRSFVATYISASEFARPEEN